MKSHPFCFETRTGQAGLVLCALVFSVSLIFARPQFLILFDRDPYSNAAWHGQCATCHLNPNGGGERNSFGLAFARNGFKFTPELRSSFPERFLSEPRSSHEPHVQFNDKTPNLVVVELNGEKIEIDTNARTFKKAGPAAVVAPASVPPGKEVAQQQEPPAPTVLDHYFVNLPSALPYARHSLNLHFTHRFNSTPFDDTRGGGPSNLFGFDGFSISGFGLTYGVTDRIAVRAYRSPLLKTIELGGEVSILQESPKIPFSLKALASVEGRNNFKLTVANRFFYDHIYGGNFQLVLSRSIRDRAEFAVIPTLSTNTRAFPDFTSTKNNTAAIGLATSIKLTRRSALVAEYIPRISGYERPGTQPSVSFGIQHMTLSGRHVFSLVISKTQATTTGQDILGGSIFKVGFNVYRRIF